MITHQKLNTQTTKSPAGTEGGSYAGSASAAESSEIGKAPVQLQTNNAQHASACTCPSCTSGQAQDTIQKKADTSQSDINPSGIDTTKPIQLACSICTGRGLSGPATHHSEKNCRYRKTQRQNAKAFNAAKRADMGKMQKQERDRDKSDPFKRKKKAPRATAAFREKHQASSKTALKSRADDASANRQWGRGGQSGTSTMVAMSEEDTQKEARYFKESLKMSEASVSAGGEGIEANRNVSKPTRGTYVTRSDKVSTDRGGRRTVKTGEVERARPVLGQRGGQFNHLEGVEKVDK